MADTPDALAARLAELEARFTLQQTLLDELSDVLYRQQRELDALGARTKALETRLSSVGAGGDDAPPDEVPPHY